MKHKDIKIGSLYVAKVNGRLTTVRVLDIRGTWDRTGRLANRYDVVNLTTGRELVFRNPSKFRRKVNRTA